MALTPRQTKTAEARRERLVELCRSLPEFEYDKVGDGHLALRVRNKTFAYYEYDHHGDGRIGLVAKSTKAEQARLVKLDSQTYYVPAYVGAKGWAGMRLDLPKVDWEMAGAICRAAYRLSAPKKLAAQVEG
jgi:hypothetical protein